MGYFLKICDLTQSYTPTSGGIRTYIDEKQKYISNFTNYKHVLIIPGKENSVSAQGNCKKYTIKASMVPSAEPYRFTFRMDRVFRILQKEKPDIIELGSGYVMPYAALMYKLLHPSCVIVGFYHTDYPNAYVYPYLQKHFPHYIVRVGLKVSQWYARLLYNRCDANFAPSFLIRSRLLKMNIQNIRHVNLGVDIDLFNPAKRQTEWRQQLGIGDDNKLLIYAGRFDSEKRIDILLKAFALISTQFRGRFALIGEGPLKALVQSYAETNPNILLLPYETSKERLALFLASADLYVTAGPYETFGLSIIEAQASGLPVIGVAAGALLERVDDKVGRLVSVDSVKEFAQAILDLSENEYVLKGKFARKRIVSQFSWQTSFENLFNHYEKLLSKAQKKQMAFEPTFARF